MMRAWIFALALLAYVAPAKAQFNSFPPGAFSTKAASDPASAPPPVPAHVQSAGQFNGTVSGTGPWTWNLTVTAIGSGNALCVEVGYSSTSADSITVTDGSGNTYTSAGSPAIVSGYVMHGFYATNVTGAPTVLTVTDSTANRGNVSLVIDEFSGVASSGAFDGASFNQQTSPPVTTDAVTSLAITTTTNGDLICGLQVQISASAPTVGTGFTRGNNLVGGFISTEYMVQSAAGSVAATWTAPGTGVNYDNAVIALKP